MGIFACIIMNERRRGFLWGQITIVKSPKIDGTAWLRIIVVNLNKSWLSYIRAYISRGHLRVRKQIINLKFEEQVSKTFAGDEVQSVSGLIENLWLAWKRALKMLLFADVTESVSEMMLKAEMPSRSTDSFPSKVSFVDGVGSKCFSTSK